MAGTCLLDTGVIIDALNDRNARNQFLEGMLGAGILLACCSISITEVFMGMRNQESKKTQAFLSGLAARIARKVSTIQSER